MAGFLGEILVKHGLISEVQLVHALVLQHRSGGRLGDILIGEGIVAYHTLYRALAEHYDLPFVNLLQAPPEFGLLHREEADTYLQLQAIPYRQEHGKLTLAVCDPSPEVRAWVKHRFRKQVIFVITSPFDIRRTVETVFGADMESSSRLSLWQQRPLASARIMLAPRQKVMLCSLLGLLAAMGILMPYMSILTLLMNCYAAFTITLLFKCWIFKNGMGAPIGQRGWKKRLAALADRNLPVYTVLLPMAKEAAVLPKLVQCMRHIDYPAAKLDIKLVLESDDWETIDAALALKLPYQFEIIRVPPSSLRTKPRACNYALRFARGEFVTIFDADDEPERLQLKKAVYAFRTLEPDVICLQARLNYYNANENLLTRFFSLEYTILFHVLLYGLERLGIPIPLGGTSNHIALERLKALGEWDPYNVTEDADLGTRLAARGYRTAMLDSDTMEEAPVAVAAWIRQRSRWIKGYMQTWLVHMRRPVELYRTLGWKSFIGFQLFVGFSVFTFLMAPVVWGISLLWVGWLMYARPELLVPSLAWLLFNLLLYWVIHWRFAIYGLRFYRKRSRQRIKNAAWLYPAYLVLHSIASYRALWQLILKPHFWEKTTHGVTRHVDLSVMESELQEASV